MSHNYKKFAAGLAAMMMLNPAIADEPQKFYGYMTYDWNQKSGFVSFTEASIGSPTMVKATSIDGEHLSGGAYLDGKLYGYTFKCEDYDAIPSYSYNVYDAKTFDIVKHTSRVYDKRVISMTYDYTTNTMYALAEDEVTETVKTARTSLHIVDLATGNLTRVGYAGDLKALNGYNRLVETTLMTLAADDEGNLYAMSDLRNFYKIDKHSGKATQIGQQHKRATDNEFQSMTFGLDGQLYWAQKHPDYGWFSKINHLTGEVDTVGTIGNNAQITALFVERTLTKNFPVASTGLTATLDQTSHKKVTLNWTLPTADYAGNSLTPTGVVIYRLGKEQPIATLAAGTTTFVDENAGNGINSYEVVALNGEINGVPALCSLFAGYDQLKQVQNLHVDYTGTTATLTWEKPVATVNGEWSDFDNITYNVYRVTTSGYSLISEGQTATTFSETLTTPGAYTYVVEPISGGVVGLAAKSEDFAVTEEFHTIPYTTGFEDNQDGPAWKTINATHTSTAYGWSIVSGYSYQRLDGKFAQFKTNGSSDPANDWLISPKIKMSKGTYTLKYFANGSLTSDAFTWEVRLGTSQSDTTTFATIIDQHKDEKIGNTWGYTVEKTITITEDGMYFIGFHGTTSSTYATLKIDNLSITSNGSAHIDDVNKSEAVICLENNSIKVTSDKELRELTLVGLNGQTLMSTKDKSMGTGALPCGEYVVKALFADGSIVSRKVKK